LDIAKKSALKKAGDLVAVGMPDTLLEAVVAIVDSILTQDFCGRFVSRHQPAQNVFPLGHLVSWHTL
jgi:hypothetical protein